MSSEQNQPVMLLYNMVQLASESDFIFESDQDHGKIRDFPVPSKTPEPLSSRIRQALKVPGSPISTGHLATVVPGIKWLGMQAPDKAGPGTARHGPGTTQGPIIVPHISGARPV